MVTRLASSHGVQEQSRVHLPLPHYGHQTLGVNKKEVTGRVFSENQDNNIQSLEYCVQIVENVLKSYISQEKHAEVFLKHFCSDCFVSSLSPCKILRGLAQSLLKFGSRQTSRLPFNFQ